MTTLVSRLKMAVLNSNEALKEMQLKCSLYYCKGKDNIILFFPLLMCLLNLQTLMPKCEVTTEQPN